MGLSKMCLREGNFSKSSRRLERMSNSSPSWSERQEKRSSHGSSEIELTSSFILPNCSSRSALKVVIASFRGGYHLRYSSTSILKYSRVGDHARKQSHNASTDTSPLLPTRCPYSETTIFVMLPLHIARMSLSWDVEQCR